MQKPTPTSLMLRRMTASAVLDALRAGGPMTGSDLIGATGLARPTVHVVCNDLIRLGWIREMDSRPPTGEARRGRPARCYDFQSRAGFVLGIDATDQVRVRVADLRGDRVAEAGEPLASVSVPAGERVAAVRRAADAALSSAAVDPARVLAVTVGLPTPVSADGRPTGREAYLPGLPGRDIGPEIAGRHGWPVLLENDANLAARGERWRGVAAGVDDLVVMVADERLGSGLFLGGRPVRGHAGGAGELRFLEQIDRVGSTYGIAYLVRTLGAEAVAGLGRRGRPRRRGRLLWTMAGGDPARVQTATVLEAARAGDELALEVVDQVADLLIRHEGKKRRFAFFLMRATAKTWDWPHHEGRDTFLISPERIGDLVRHKGYASVWEASEERVRAMVDDPTPFVAHQTGPSTVAASED
jgi:predicted NBD/HSP70 family sugar kinase